MLLFNTEIQPNETNTNIDFEKVANNLVMISIDNDTRDQKEIPSYWRLRGNRTNPPLEIGINTSTGTIREIVIFVDADCFDQFDLDYIHTSKGNVLVDCSIFTRKNDFIDVDGLYFISLKNNKLICKFSKEINVNEIVVNGELEYYVDEIRKIVGFGINNLNESTLKTLHSIL